MWMMPLHLHVNQKSDYDYDDMAQVNVNFVLLTFLSRYGRFLLASLFSVLVAWLRSMLTLFYLLFSPDMGDFC